MVEEDEMRGQSTLHDVSPILVFGPIAEMNGCGKS